MTSEIYKYFFIELDNASKAAIHLKNSLTRYDKLNLDVESLTDKELEILEALSSRFERLADIILHKLLRSIDELDQEYSPSVRHILLKSDKKGIISGYQYFLKIRELRNLIAHDYSGNRIIEIVANVKTLSEVLFKDLNSIESYAQMNYK